jgi:hypothetical protein
VVGRRVPLTTAPARTRFCFSGGKMISRSFFAAVLLASSALAGPPLTTIQDVLYKADGTRFAGTLAITWTSFEAIDTSAIATQAINVTVTDGNLRVQLVPTTTAVPAASYMVRYNSDGRIQFSETWAVPSSITPLRLRDVRIASTQGGATNADIALPTVQESDVAGLISDLGARPLKGPAYAGGRVAVVNPTGSLESVTGIPSDCVRVDGSSGPCGGALPSFVDGESPSGTMDGSNTTFILSVVPDPASSLAVYRNGVLQKLVQDYNLTGSSVQFAAGAAPQPGDALLASYRLTGNDSGAGTGPGGGGSGGAVSSVFGRTGVVIPAVGDYTAAQVANAVDAAGSYSNPAWLASLAYAKITGAPSFESPLTFGAPLSRSVNTISLAVCADGEIRKYRTLTGWTCEADQVGAAGGGITALNGLTPGIQTLAAVNDTNVIFSINSAGSIHTFTAGWTGALAKTRQHAATLYSDAAYADPAWITLTAGGGRITGFSATAPLLFNSGAFSIPAATSLADGYLTALDRTAFAAKQAAISGAPGIWPSFGGAALLNVGGVTGTVAAGDDSRLADSRTPTSHAASHQNGGLDPVATVTPGANVIPQTGPLGKLAIGFLASGAPDGTKFVRDDGTLASPGNGWGSITGTLSNQADLNSALALKAPIASLAPVATSGLASDLAGALADASLSTNVPLKDGTNAYTGANAYTGTVDAHGAAKTIPYRTGTGSPATRDACATPGEVYFQTDAAAGSNTFACTGIGIPGTWSLEGGGATANQNIRDITVSFDGGGLALTGTATRCREVGFAGTIQGVYIDADQSGSLTIDVRTVLHSGYTGPGSAATITAAAIPALASAAKYTDETLTGWNTALAAKTSVCFAMSSPATVQWAAITLKVAAN